MIVRIVSLETDKKDPRDKTIITAEFTVPAPFIVDYVHNGHNERSQLDFAEKRNRRIKREEENRKTLRLGEAILEMKR